MRASLPMIDLRKTSSAKGEAQVSRALHEAFRDLGFAYIKNHGFDPALLRDLKKYSKLFFRLPLEQKNQLAMQHAGLAWRGYFPVGAEYTAAKQDQKEGIYFGVEHAADHPMVKAKQPMHGANLWPLHPGLAGLEDVVSRYMKASQDLAQNIMKLLAKGLGLSPDYFAGRFEGEPTCLFRVFNYPKGLSDGSSWGVGPHTDMGFLTILAPGEQGGLQVKGRDGEFFDVHPIEGAFVLNIGDMLEYWTGGIYKATVHRVTNTADEDRLSFPFFFDPAWNANLLPIPNELLSAEDLSLVSADVKDRWDGLNLKELSSSLTYGEFVWDKIKDVFPQLSGSLK